MSVLTPLCSSTGVGRFCFMFHSYLSPGTSVRIYITDELMYNGAEVIIMPTNKPQYCITVDEELLKQIDDFRFENRFNSRSKATVKLICLGLATIKQQEDKKV